MSALRKWFESFNRPVQSVMTPDVEHKKRNSDQYAKAVHEKANEIRSASKRLTNLVDELLVLNDQATGRDQ